MKRFITYTLLFLAPVVLVLSVMEYMLREIPSTYRLKAEYLHQDEQRVKILCLGNSSGAYGFDPQYFSKYTFNAAQVSQSLDMDCAIVEKEIDRLDSLEYILLAVSYPSLFFKLETSVEKWRLPYYRYYGIDTGYSESRKPLIFQDAMGNNVRRIKQYYINKDDPAYKMTRQGMIELEPATNLTALQVKAKEVAIRHTVRSLNMPLVRENAGYIIKIVEMARQKNARVILVTLPFHEDYRKYTYDKQMNILRGLMNDLSKNEGVYYYDMNEYSSGYTTEDFFDGNHLSRYGAKKVSLQLDSIIKSLDRNRTL